ncbi:glycerol-3-phosphate cytidylyltransferase [Fictibacillus sp. UD]|uniref:glycerol-3-phosphate cytidylyltransferase n=1 Tax=Fictibacillus sp. UD TaxID=3038777 RepID=UPI0037472C5E
MKKKIVITYGTFDVLHYGHINLLKRAKALGDHLIVGLSTDEFNELKGKKSYYSYYHRKEILQSIKYVDNVIPEECWEQKALDLKNYEVDIFVMGNDWEGKFDFLSDNCKVIYLPRTEGISSTLIRESVLT